MAVRSGRVTPQIDDEEQARSELGLPPLSPESRELWKEQGGYRRPITLRDELDEPAEVENEDD